MFLRLIRLIVNLFQFNRTNWRAVALCFLAAAIFWLFNAFNKSYSTNIRFPLQFEYDQQRYVQAAPLPGSININVTGNGWDLFRKHFGVKVPELVIPLERPLEIKKIVASTLPPILVSQIGALQINFVVTDTLFIQIDDRDVHKFRLVADASALQFEKGLGRVSPIIIQPDTISIEGPKKLLHAMADSIVVKLPVQRVKENFREEVEVTLENSEFLKRSTPLVEVLFEVGPVMEVARNLKVELPEGFKTATDSVRVYFEIPSSLLNDFHVNRSMRLVLRPVNSNVQARVSRLPSYARFLKADSISYTAR